MEGHYSTGQSPQWAVVPMEEEEVSTISQCVSHHVHLTQMYVNTLRTGPVLYLLV